MKDSKERAVQKTTPELIANGALHDSAELMRQWARGADAYSQWMVALLDSQAAWWKDMERGAADLMSPWLSAMPAPPSAQPLIDAAQGLSGPALMTALSESWNAWGQVWMNALQHDVPGAGAMRRD